MGDGDTLLNAFIGAVVGVLLSFLPFAIVIGGALAGYLQGATKDYAEGARVGGLAGFIALVPVLVLLFTVGGFLLTGIGPGISPRMGGAFSLFGIVVVLLTGGYLVGGGALGGVVGAYLVDEL